MELDSNYREGLLLQIKEAYGRIVYTYTTHLKKAELLKNHLKWIKYSQIVLSAISSGGFLASLISNKQILNIVGGICAVILLCVNLFFKNFDMEEEIKNHTITSNQLWLVREKYVSLMTDFEVLENEEIIDARDSLQHETYEIYKNAPKTDSKSYKKAQKALKQEEEQFFTNEELNQMLPSHLRT